MATRQHGYSWIRTTSDGFCVNYIDAQQGQNWPVIEVMARTIKGPKSKFNFAVIAWETFISFLCEGRSYSVDVAAGRGTETPATIGESPRGVVVVRMRMARSACAVAFTSGKGKMPCPDTSFAFHSSQ